MRKYNKFQSKKDSVVQIAKSKKIQFRLSGDELILFENQKIYYGIENESEFIRECFMDRIYKNEIKRQEDEISDL